MCSKIIISNGYLRPWMAKDKYNLLKYANNKNIACNLRDAFPYPYTEKDADLWLNNPIHNEADNIIRAIVYDNEVVGGIGIYGNKDIYKKNGEIGYWLGEPFWNKGIVTEAVKAITTYALQNTDLIRIYAGVFSSNPASGKVLEKAGYAKEATHKNAIFKNNKILDEIIYAFYR